MLWFVKLSVEKSDIADNEFIKKPIYAPYPGLKILRYYLLNISQ
jgi:hypothetical protein